MAEDTIPFLILRPVVFNNFFDFSNGILPYVHNKNALTVDQSSLIKTIDETTTLILDKKIPHKSNFLFKIFLIQKYIVSNPNKNFSLDELSKMTSRCSSWLSSRFSSTTGISIGQLKSKVKLCWALWEIINTEKSIKEISIDIGYDPLYFSHKFKLIFGCSPSSSRKY